MFIKRSFYTVTHLKKKINVRYKKKFGPSRTGPFTCFDSPGYRLSYIRTVSSRSISVSLNISSCILEYF